jgi:hypothetical protein
MYNRNGAARLPFRDAGGNAADRVLLGPLKLVPARAPAVPTPGHLRAAGFGGAIDLVGYDLAGAARPGGTLTVSLVWSDVRNPGADLTAFVHLLDAGGKLVAQSDGQPGPYPTSLWQPGDQTRDQHVIALPRRLAPGAYQLEVGLYRGDTGARLPTASGDRVILDSKVDVAGD